MKHTKEELNVIKKIKEIEREFNYCSPDKIDSINQAIDLAFSIKEIYHLSGKYANFYLGPILRKIESEHIVLSTEDIDFLSTFPHEIFAENGINHFFKIFTKLGYRPNNESPNMLILAGYENFWEILDTLNILRTSSTNLKEMPIRKTLDKFIKLRELPILDDVSILTAKEKATLLPIIKFLEPLEYRQAILSDIGYSNLRGYEKVFLLNGLLPSENESIEEIFYAMREEEAICFLNMHFDNGKEIFDEYFGEDIYIKSINTTAQKVFDIIDSSSIKTISELEKTPIKVNYHLYGPVNLYRKFTDIWVINGKIVFKELEENSPRNGIKEVLGWLLYSKYVKDSVYEKLSALKLDKQKKNPWNSSECHSRYTHIFWYKLNNHKISAEEIRIFLEDLQTTKIAKSSKKDITLKAFKLIFTEYKKSLFDSYDCTTANGVKRFLSEVWTEYNKVFFSEALKKEMVLKVLQESLKMPKDEFLEIRGNINSTFG